MAEPAFHRHVPSIAVISTPSMTSVLVPAEQDRVVLTLGDREEYTISLIEADLAQLMTALVEGEISYVSSTHAAHGRALLSVRPAGDRRRKSRPGEAEPGPRELSLTRPDQGTCRVVFDTGQAVDLVRELDAAWGLLTQGQPD